MDLWAYFRFTSLSVLLGIAMFFFCYATWVWRRRQPASRDNSILSRLFKTSCTTALFAGGLLALVSAIISEIVPIQGVMRLNESYAARTRLDTEVKYLAPLGPIQKGDVLTQFAPSELESQIRSLQAKHAKLSAEYDKTQVMPLEIDEELTRRHQNSLSEIELAQATLNTLKPLLKETIRTGLELRLERKDKIVAIDRYLIDYEATRNQSFSEYGFKFKDYERTSHLAANNASTKQQLELSRHQAVAQAEQVKKLDKTIDQFRQEIEHLNQSNQQFDDLIQQHVKSLESEIAAVESQQRQAQSELNYAEDAIALDLQRAQKQRDAELSMLTAEMQEVQADITSLQTANTVHAPQDGVVVYRSAAANSVEEHGVILVMAKDQSAEVQFSLPESLLSDLRENNSLEIWIEDSVLTTKLTGRVRESSPSQFHDDHVIVAVECQPPMDLIPHLANEQLIPIKLTWHPPLMAVLPFQLGLGLFAFGLTGSLLTMGFSSSPAKKHTSTQLEPTSTSSQTSGSRNHFGLHQGPSGVMLQILGNRFRESVFTAQVDGDLVASIEWAIDRHQDRGIKFIRQGFISAVAEGEDFKLQLDDALRILDIDESMRQRLTSLIDTLQIHSEANWGTSQAIS